MNQRSLLLLLVLTAVIFCSYKIIKAENERIILKEDVIELSKIKYGLFSVDEWKKILSRVLAKKVDEFNVNNNQRKELKAEISAALYKMIGQFEDRYYEENSQSLGGIFKSSVALITGTFGHLKKDIPKFTDEILNFLSDKKNKKAIKGFIRQKIDDYADKTFSKMDYTEHNRIILKYDQKDRETAIEHLNTKLSQIDSTLLPYKVALLVLAAALVLFVVFSSTLTKKDFLLLTGLCFVLLFSGLLLPMIEIDARIAEMKFTLIGEPVSFQDQVLYYKSKSILQVVKVMVTQARADLLLVGFLVFLFSVLFPVAKLISSLLFIHSEKFKNSRFIQFMVFKTGKWSMADVMVIAIFMSYIGFSGIITEQLKQIEVITQTMEVLTTNKSSLMAGFYFFTAFALLSLLISHKLQYGVKGQSIS
jgi:hypothetical protein